MALKISTYERVPRATCSFLTFGGVLPIKVREGHILLAEGGAPRWAGKNRESFGEVLLTKGFQQFW